MIKYDIVIQSYNWILVKFNSNIIVSAITQLLSRK